MRWTVIRGSSLQSVPWRNGHGTSRNILTRLGRDGALLWQVGVAELVGDAPFSVYPHCDRIFTPIAGDPPVQLSFDDGPFESCPLLVPKPFPGERPCRCRVPAPGRAFNAIVDRRHFTAAVQILHLAAGTPIQAPEAPDTVLYCLTGEFSTPDDRLQPGDSLLGPGPATPATTTQPSTVITVAIHPTTQ